MALDSKVRWFRCVLLADYAYEIEAIDDDEYAAVYRTVEDVIGRDPLDLLSLVACLSHWSPDDFKRYADDDAACTLLYVQCAEGLQPHAIRAALAEVTG